MCTYFLEAISALKLISLSTVLSRFSADHPSLSISYLDFPPSVGPLHVWRVGRCVDDPKIGERERIDRFW